MSNAWVLCPHSSAAPASRCGAHRPGSPGRCPWGTSAETCPNAWGNATKAGKHMGKITQHIIYGYIYIHTYVDIYIYVDVYITRVHVCEANFLQKQFFFGNCLIALLLRLAPQQCTKPQTSTNGGHEWEEDVRCHGGAPESRNVWVCLLLRGTTLET